MYTWNPGDYARHSSAQKKWGEDLIGKLSLRGDERVLDIGCGDGALTAMIASLLPRGEVTGIDRSGEMIAHARFRYPVAEYPNCHFIAVDAREMIFESEFDLAFSNAALHWIREQGQLLERLSRALKPGGRLLFQMGGYGNAEDFFVIATTIATEYQWKSFFEGFTPPWRFCSDREYSVLLEAAGFIPLRVDLVPVDMVHADRQGLEGWVRTTWIPFLERLPACKQEEFIGEVVDRYLAFHPTDREGRTHVRMVRLEAEAVKTGPGAARVLRHV
ncbi:trans-aconitate methyltransferase [Methanolinea mesophila]|uniref:methyltransferase domain-containing protein n=1 Tax=Methanolinea mesophila TaxID=547055 RepID=UPI001AE14A8B|nr:trans-aconitate methyltransferase [Methanolinea mesophila]